MTFRIELDKSQRVLLSHATMHFGHIDNDMLNAERLDDRRVGHVTVVSRLCGTTSGGLNYALRGNSLAKQLFEMPLPDPIIYAFVEFAAVDALENSTSGGQFLQK